MARLELEGYAGGVLPLWLEGDPEREPLALVFPGLRYSPARPLLHFSRKLLRSRGWAVAEVWYDYDRPEFLTAAREERGARLLADAVAAYAWALSNAKPRLLLGKSIGTLALALLTREHAVAIRAAKVWLTPLLNEPAVTTAIREDDAPGLLVAGAADPITPAEALAELRREGLHLLVLPHADHSLENSDTLRSLDILRDYLLDLSAFLETL